MVPDLNKMTPMLQQYYELKKDAPDCILFFRMGDFYEAFGKDSELIAPILQLVLTSRDKGKNLDKIPFCGVPHHSLKPHITKLLKKGFKIAIADQVEDPALAKGLVKRAITKIITPGCIEDLDNLEQEKPNYVCAFFEEPKSQKWVLALCDVSTGEIKLGNFATDKQLQKYIDIVEPKEIFTRSFMLEEWKTRLNKLHKHENILFSSLPEAVLNNSAEQQDIILNIFGKKNTADFPCGTVHGGNALIAALLTYLQSIHISTAQFSTIKQIIEPRTMNISDNVIRDLELFETYHRRQVKGSLFHTLNHTVSPMGARLLRQSMFNPSIVKDKITERHNAVKEFLNLGENLLATIRLHLKNTNDLVRLRTRVLTEQINPNELAKIKKTLNFCDWFTTELNSDNYKNFRQTPLIEGILDNLIHYQAPYKLLENCLAEEVKGFNLGHGIFKKGYCEKFDDLLELHHNGATKVSEYQQQLREETKIPSLKIKPHKTYGLLIEVTKTHLNKVPDHFIRRQTMVNNDRFITETLQDLNENLAGANELAISYEQQLYTELITKLKKYSDNLQTLALSIATFDLLQSFAWLSLRNNYCRPKISKGSDFDVINSRHPVVEKIVGSHEFVCNNITINNKQKCMLITGPNMAGKSTIMRQVALSAIMSQIGCFVPAEMASIPIFDQIFTRIGAADDLAAGQSTFMVEMSESAEILRNATKNSLVILDEVGRGTSTQDGLALAKAILLEVAQKIKCYTLFATHYHELVPFSKNIKNMSIMQTEVIKNEFDIVFTHRLKEGASGSSYGLEVAKLAGIPARVLAEAQKSLDSTTVKFNNRKTPETKFKTKNSVDLGNPELVSRLENVDLNRLTPIQALNFLNKLKSDSFSKPPQPLFDFGIE